MAEAPREEPSSEALETALPTLAAKLTELQRNLSPQERDVLETIINSAATHLAGLQVSDTLRNVSYAKPISAVATMGIRSYFLNLPETLGSKSQNNG